MPSPFLDLWQTRDAERWTRDDAGCATRYDRTSTWRDGASEVIERESTCDEQGNPVDEEERAEAYTAAGDRDLVLTDGSYDLAYEQDQLALRDSTSCVNVPPSSTSECRLWNDTWERDDAGHARVWMYDEAWSIADDTRTEYTWEGALLSRSASAA